MNAVAIFDFNRSPSFQTNLSLKWSEFHTRNVARVCCFSAASIIP